MKLLIVTQKVDQNDDVLGFFHGWIKEFAKHCEQVTVIALGVGEYNLPKNVRVFSLGKELRERSDLKNLGTRSVLEEQLRKARYALNFYYFIWRECKNYDAVFVHMNPIYVVLGGLFWSAWGKKIGLWYTHKHVDLKLRIAEKLSDIIFTASRESFRLDGNKLQITGHGIDTEIFRPSSHPRGEILQICSIARISETKNQKLMIDVIEILKTARLKAKLHIAGSALTGKDKVYEKNIREIVRDKNLSDEVIFSGNIMPREVPGFLQKMDLLINASNTGSLDKAVLEAMACGIPLVTSNEAFSSVLGADASALMFTVGDASECARSIKKVITLSLEDREALSKRLRATVEKEHNIEMLIPHILSFYETTS